MSTKPFVLQALERLKHYGIAQGMPGDPIEDFFLAEQAEQAYTDIAGTNRKYADRIRVLETAKGTPTNFEDVMKFRMKFNIPSATKPSLPTMENQEFRMRHLQEELDELDDSFENKNLEGMADAIIDLVYVAMGLAADMALPWQELWDEVQRANMSKVRATSAEQSKRGSALDVVKPEGWRKPEHWIALGLPCPGCSSQGFTKSTREAGHCSFCDGTEGGQ